MDNYNFIMIGRRIDSEKYVGKIVWIKGTIQVEEKDKDSIAKLLKESMEKVLKLAHPRFHWRDVSLIEQASNVPKGIRIEDLALWEWYSGWDEPSGFKERYTAEWINELNSKLLKEELANEINQETSQNSAGGCSNS